MAITEPIPVPHGGKSGTHGCQSTPGIFNMRRIVLETGAVLADGPGITQLNGIKYFHVSMRCNGSPIMTENDHREHISYNYVYNHAGSECDNRLDTRVSQFTESRRKPDA